MNGVGQRLLKYRNCLCKGITRQKTGKAMIFSMTVALIRSMVMDLFRNGAGTTVAIIIYFSSNATL